MSLATALGPSFIVAARRTALGRPGGLHAARRIESLAAPVVQAALRDAGLGAETVQQIILGNTTAGGNPARIVGLTAGLSDTAAALTVDRQCASGLDAILIGMRAVAMGEADVVVAGGAESISTAPWRVARPRSLFQTPRFLGPEPDAGDAIDAPQLVAASEALARRLGITRERQDNYTFNQHLKAERAASERRFLGEIVPLRMAGEEARDETTGVEDIDDLADLEPLLPEGTLTSGNTSALQDGAAVAVIVSGAVHADLGAPRALRLVASSINGVGAGDEAGAPVAALQKLMRSNGGPPRQGLGLIEMSEASAAQALAVRDAFDLSEDALNPDGGAIVRGHPLGAASAVSVTRLFTRMVRHRNGGGAPHLGAVTQGAIGGFGVAALFETVG
jgi:acetyl-CoA C-acetyltransferase